jgi:hypothetical protein
LRATGKVLGLMMGALLLAAPTIAQPFPDGISLPTGFQPDGIAAGRARRSS